MLKTMLFVSTIQVEVNIKYINIMLQKGSHTKYIFYVQENISSF